MRKLLNISLHEENGEVSFLLDVDTVETGNYCLTDLFKSHLSHLNVLNCYFLIYKKIYKIVI